MIEEKVEWEPTCKRFVAFLDIMGFKDLVFRKDPKFIIGMFDSLLALIEKIKKRAEQPLIMLTSKTPGKEDIVSYPSSVYPVMFSDSIILISNDKTEISSMFIFNCVSNFLKLAIKRGIPVKGAIAFGEMTVKPDKSLFFGQPLIDAFELQNELKMYSVILHHTCESHLRELKNIEGKGIVQYLVPMKSGKITHYIVDWTDFFENGDPLDSVTKLYDTVSGKPRVYVDNTIGFLN